MNLLNFFIDELGTADRKEKFSTHYILSGCMVNEYSREWLKIRSDQIKFKYWGKTDIVFHSREIGRKSGVFSILKVTSNFLSVGIPSLSIKVEDIQNALTEVAFVTKKNFDIEEQIADLLVYGAKLKLKGKKIEQMNEYEKNIYKIMNQKLFKMHPETGEKKKKFYSSINSFEVLP